MRKNGKKLWLKSETVRVLTDAELGRAQGGFFMTPPVHLGGGVAGPTTTAINCTAKCNPQPTTTVGTTGILCGGGGTGPATTAINCPRTA
jgi:hypothetical protein